MTVHDRGLAPHPTGGDDVVVVCDEAGVITLASGPLPDLLGFEPEQITGKNVGDFLHPRNRGVLAPLLGAVAGQPQMELWDEVRLATVDGGWRWVDAVISGIAEGRAIVAVLRPVPDPVDQVMAAREGEELYRTLVNRAADVVVLSDGERVTYVSPAVEDVLGWSPAQFASGHPGLVHPDDRARFTVLDRPVVPGAPRTRQRGRVRHADGSDRWIDATTVDLRDDPRVGAVFTLLHDVTDQVIADDALQSSERRFRKLVQHSSDLSLVLGTDDRVVWVSSSVSNVLGYAPGEMVGFRVLDFIHPEHADVVAEFLSTGLDGRTSGRLRVRHADGSWRWFEAVVADLRDDPDVRGVLVNAHDLTESVLAEQALRASEARFRSLADASPIGVFQQELTGGCSYVNGRWREITGLTEEDALGTGWMRIIHPDDFSTAVEAHERQSADRAPYRLRLRIRRPDGAVRWVEVHAAPLVDDTGEVSGTVGTVEDVTDAERARTESLRLTDVLEATSDLVAIAVPGESVLYLNDASRRFIGSSDLSSLADFVGNLPDWLIDKWHSEIEPRLRRDGIWEGELELIAADGHPVPLSTVLMGRPGADGELEVISSISRDISERKAFEARLEHEATHDPLTGLPNRALLLDRLRVALGRAERHRSSLAVLFLDLDHFKVVNDSQGHGLGDRVLEVLAERLDVAVRPGDTVARFGGDEFVVLCEDLSDPREAERIADRIASVVAKPVDVDAAAVFVTASIGIAFADPEHSEPEALLRDADAAMYQAKARGRARYEVFDAQTRSRAVDRHDLENDLRRAIERDELCCHFQLEIDLATGRPVGAEALLRWHHPERGLLAPRDFLSIAEQTRLIVPIGEKVLADACALVTTAVAETGHDLFVSVNLGAAQLAHPALAPSAVAMLEGAGVDPRRVVFEITEDVLMDDVGEMEALLRRLKDLGLRLAIDDFGTGYSSLHHLRRFPVDLLKIDRAFVAGLGRDPADAAIVAAILHLAGTLGLAVVAEGVETRVQLEELRRLGCGMAQGFLLAPPMPAPELVALLRTDPTW